MASSVLRQSNILRRNALFSNIPIKQISTSQPRNIHPLIALFAKPISRVAAAILGSYIGRNYLKVKRMPSKFRPQNIVG